MGLAFPSQSLHKGPNPSREDPVPYQNVKGHKKDRSPHGTGDPPGRFGTEVLAPLNRVRETFAVNRLAQAAGLAALEDKEFLEKSIAANHAGRLYLYGEFERLGLRYIESHTNFILVEIGPQAIEVQGRLVKKGVIVRPCEGYDLCDFLRITVGDAAQNARLIEALESVLEELGQPCPA